MVCLPLFAFASIDSLDAFFIVLIKLASSSLSINQAKFPWENIENSFFPLVAVTDADLYSCPLVTLTSSLIFSDFLKVTNNLEGFLTKLFGDLSKGIVWAKQILPFPSS